MNILSINRATGCKLLGLLLTMFVMLIFVACETAQPRVGSSGVTQITPTLTLITPNAAATATTLAFRARAMGTSPQTVASDDKMPTQAASDDLVVKNYADMLTQSALTPVPTLDTNPLPTDTPEPPITPVVGYKECATVPSTHDQIVPYTCGYWLVAGQIIEAKAGRQGWLGDKQQGYLQVACIGHGTAIYDTPARVGAVGIVSAAGSRLELATYDRSAQPNSFTFDIATCQWVARLADLRCHFWLDRQFLGEEFAAVHGGVAATQRD